MFGIMPLRHRCGDQGHALRPLGHHRHLGHNPAPVIGEIGQSHPAFARQGAGGQSVDIFPRPRPLHRQPGEPGNGQHATAIPHGFALGPDPGLPRPGAVPGVGRRIRHIIARFGKPVGAFPAIIGPKHRARRLQPAVQRRQFLVRPGGPAVPGKMHRIFMAIGFNRLGLTIGRIGVTRKSARVARPHIPFGAALGHPFGQHLARATGLGDAKGEHASLKRIFHPRHRADQRQPIGGIGDRAVDHLAHTGLGQHRHAGHRILHIPFQPLQIVGEQLKTEIFRHLVLRFDPMRLAVAFIRAQVQAIFFLPQIIGTIDIAQQRQLAVALGPVLQLGDRFGQEILVAHHRHRHGAATIGLEPLANFLRVIACGVDHLFTGDIALGGMHNPAVFCLGHAGRRGKAQNLRAQLPGTFGQGLRQLCGINVTIIGVKQSPRQIMGFQKRIAGFQVRDLHHFQRHALHPAHAAGAFKFLHALFGMAQPD